MTPLTKICTVCSIDKLLALFSKKKGGKYGLNSQCKLCRSAADKIWVNKNPEKSKAIARTLHKANPGYNKAAMKLWRQTNLEKCNVYTSKYRALKKQAALRWADTEFEKFAIEEMYALANLRSKLLGITFHVDHIDPLNSPIVQGLHCVSNLQILESKLNMSKGNRSWPDMPL